MSGSERQAVRGDERRLDQAPGDPSGGGDDAELARQRTVSAEHRTLLTRDLAFSAWVRTGLTAVVAGVAVVQLMQEFSPSWLPRAIGVAFVAAGGVIEGMAFLHYREERLDLSDDESGLVPIIVWGLVTLVLLIGAVLALVLLLIR